MECIFDNNPSKIGKTVEGVEIKNVVDFSQETLRGKYIVIASKLKQDDIHDQLEMMGLKYSLDFYHYPDFVAMCREELTSKLELVNSLL